MIVQACGDAHLSNFGLFGSPERKLVFDVNDFDETLPAPWEWDVKRLAASLEVAARENGFSDKDRRKIVLASTARYRQVMRQLAGLTNLDVWYTQVDIDELPGPVRQHAEGAPAQGARQGPGQGPDPGQHAGAGQADRIEDGQPRIISEPPVIVPLRDLLGELAGAVDIAKELKTSSPSTGGRCSPTAGCCSSSMSSPTSRARWSAWAAWTRCWIILMLGRDETDPLFLQVKEAEESVLGPVRRDQQVNNQGERVVNGQRLMQAASDIFLGWQRFAGLDGTPRDFYVRQLRDWKFSVNIAAMIPRGLRLYGELCGLTLARAHARSGDEIAMASYLGNSEVFENAIADFAGAYADQNERDFEAFNAAISSGRLLAERGV